jgi:L-fucose mutarotase
LRQRGPLLRSKPELHKINRMLKGIDPLLTPDLLHALASAGHGDVVAIVDANFPATRLARRLIRLPGNSAPAVLDAILSVMPIDDFEAESVSVMQAAELKGGAQGDLPDPVREFIEVLGWHEIGEPVGIERYAFYAAAEDAFVIVQTGERRFYGNILLTKGAIPPI